MLAGVIVVAGGLFAVSAITQLYGYRLGGTITIPVLALYTLKTAWMLPVFVLSAILGYLALDIARKTTLIYGRQELLFALVTGSAPPTLMILALPTFFPATQETVSSLAFIGGIIPGLAAYNFHKIRPEYRVKELGVSTLLAIILIGIGVLLVSPHTTILTRFTPSILFSQTSDIAHLRDAVVTRNVPPEIAARPLIIGLLGVGMALVQTIRARLGLRIGIITLGLMALFTVSSHRLLILFLILLPISFATITLCNRRLMLYGRVLIGIGSGIGILLAPLVLQFMGAAGSARGLSALFVGLIAGVDAYNIHTTPPVERRQSLPLAVAVYAVLLLLTRSFVEPFRRGFPQTLGVAQVGGLLVLAALGVGIAYRNHVPLPSDKAVFSASVLSGSDEMRRGRNLGRGDE